jgi:hypothetical protein
MAIGLSTGTFVPHKPYDKVDYHLIEDRHYLDRGNKVQHVYDCKSKKEDPSIIIKWCRRNFGERGMGWDFLLVSGNVTIILWEDKFKTMYELWKV